MNLYYETGDELMHYGRKGMKWYQHIYGAAKTVGNTVRRGAQAVSTATGKAVSNYKARRQEKAEIEARKNPKSVKEMNDDELQSATKRLQAEKNYIDLQRSVSSASPKQISAGKKFLDTAMSSVITPAVTSVGKNWLEKKLKAKLGLDEKSDLDILKEAADKAVQEKRKLEAENKITEIKSARQEANRKAEKAANETNAAESAKAAAQKQVDDYNKYHSSSGTYSKKGSDIIENVFGEKKANGLMNMSTRSKQFADSSASGKQYMQEILDKYGNTIVSDYNDAA